MAKFFVGQRVKLVRPDSGSLKRGIKEGDVGVILNRDPVVDWRVGFGVKNPHTGDNSFPMFSDELEPVLPEGHRASDYSFTELMDRCRQGEVA